MESPQPLQSAPGPHISKILIPLIVVTVLVVGYGVLAKNYGWWPHEAATSSSFSMTPEPSVFPTPLVISPVPNSEDTTGWQTYRISDQAFEFRVPKGFRVTQITRATSDLVMFFDIYDQNNTQYLSVIVSEFNEDEIFQGSYPRNFTEKGLTINNVTLRQKTINTFQGVERYYYGEYEQAYFGDEFLYRNAPWQYMIRLDPYFEGRVSLEDMKKMDQYNAGLGTPSLVSEAAKKDKQIYQKILSTFKFTN